jgi:hypothetical protein
VKPLRRPAITSTAKLEDPAHNVTTRKWQGSITSEAKRVTMAMPAAQADFTKKT